MILIQDLYIHTIIIPKNLFSNLIFHQDNKSQVVILMERLKFEEFFIIFYDIFFDNVNDKISSDFFININIKNKY